MNYNDYIFPTPQDYHLLQENYEKIHTLEVCELNEIISKLREQQALLQQNQRYLHIIPRLQNGIESLEKIVFSRKQHTKAQSTERMQDIAIPPFRNINKMNLSTQCGNILCNIFRKLNKQSNIPNMRFHTIISHDSEIQSHCNSHPQNCSRQLDIIRLLLLYMTLRPTCPYIHTISSVATNQLDVYISMLNIQA